MANVNYKYIGPLDPVLHKEICLPRQDQVNRVIEGLTRGDYWVIYGPRQIGKTTFLRLVKDNYPQASYVYFDFGVAPTHEKSFYRWVMKKIVEETEPGLTTLAIMETGDCEPPLAFFNFLKEFTAGEHKNIVLLLDDIDNTPFAGKFLNIWRTVFNERYHSEELKKYSLIITSTVELLQLTGNCNSPFNIVQPLYLEDFSDDEAERLIREPLEQLGIAIDPKIKGNLITLLGGHPQLLQQTGHILVQRALHKHGSLTAEDADLAICELFKSNSTLDILMGDLKREETLKHLVCKILKGEHINFFPHKKYSIFGAGTISEHGSECRIRNKVMEMFLRGLPVKSQERYKKKRICGRGAMGIVYKAEDSELERDVALKILKKDLTGQATYLAQFMKEAKILARFSHPNIVTVFDMGQMEGEYFISMEFVSGYNLHHLISKKCELSLNQVLYITEKVLKALDYSHKKRVVHRDIKPKNIMINMEAEVKILDFSISLIRDTQLKSETCMIIGTPYYISPEQIKKESVDHRSDIYSLGVTLYHMITGKVPFDGNDNLQILDRHLREPAPDIRSVRPDIPDELAYIVEKCMEKEREKRFQEIDDILHLLARVPGISTDHRLAREEIKRMIVNRIDDPFRWIPEIVSTNL